MSDLSPDGRLLGNDADAWCKPDAIPYDVMNEARAVAEAALMDVAFSTAEASNACFNRLADLAARAIMAERERCAKRCDIIAAGYGKWSGDMISAEVADECAAAIRKGEA